MDTLRRTLDVHVRRLLAPAAGALARSGITPDQVTVAGAALVAVAALAYAAGHPVLAGCVFLLGSSLDLMDGLLARTSNRVTAAGAFLDSTLDRVSEGMMFAAIAYRFALDGEATLVALSVVALLASVLISYTRARGEAVGVSCTVGVLSRPERVVLLGAAMIAGLVDVAVYAIVVLGLFTTMQRIVHVRQALRSAGPRDRHSSG